MATEERRSPAGTVAGSQAAVAMGSEEAGSQAATETEEEMGPVAQVRAVAARARAVAAKAVAVEATSVAVAAARVAVAAATEVASGRVRKAEAKAGAEAMVAEVRAVEG